MHFLKCIPMKKHLVNKKVRLGQKLTFFPISSSLTKNFTSLYIVNNKNGVIALMQKTTVCFF